MTQNTKRISWLFAVLVFHAAISDSTLSPKRMTGTRATGEEALESKGASARWFQYWSINSGKSVSGEFATRPGAFKYSAMVEVGVVRCSGAIVTSMWVLTSTYCFSQAGRPATSSRPKKTAFKNKSRYAVNQVEVTANPNRIGWAFAGGIRYQNDTDMGAEGVQKHRLVKLLLYTETHTERDLHQHDTMLAKVGATGFWFNEFVQPIRFTNQRRFYTAQPRTCIVVGFGANNHEIITMANLLEKCSRKAIADNLVCVDEYRWPCMSDAGAPLVCRNLLIGTLRQEGLLPNDHCEKGNEHTVQNFTFVGYYIDWIVEHAPVKFGVWRSGSASHYAESATGRRRVFCAAVLLLDTWTYMYLK